ncbi:hypothetical protein LINPERPRIM_LOCUS8174 [Linum perenne]
MVRYLVAQKRGET